MKPWPIEDLRRATKAKWLVRSTRPFTGRIETDSRKVVDGDLFIAIKGENHDAHKFILDVIRRGAAAILVHRELDSATLAEAQSGNTAILQVDDTIAALNRLAAAYRAELRAKVIAVGGSNGKTTTKRILHSLLAEKFGKTGGHASPKSFNNNIGMPLTILEVQPNHEYVVLEIGTNAPGEIAALGDVARPDIAVITSIGLEHLEKLGDLEGVAKEEASIAPFLKTGGTLVLPADAPELLAAIKHSEAQRVLVGARKSETRDPKSQAAELVATDVTESMRGVSFAVSGRGRFEMPLLGEHNVLNALLAMAVAWRMGASDEQIRAGLKKVEPAPMRLQPMQVAGFAVINDAYNANPSSMEAAIRTFAHLQAQDAAAKGRSVAILGDMLELGPSTEAMHRAVGGMVAAASLDVLVAVGPNMKHAADVAEAGGVEVVRFPDTAGACRGISDVLRGGDSILVKGSRGMALETVLEALDKSPAGVPAK